VPEERDELIGRVVDELKVLPAVPADATARVLARVDAARRGEGPSADADDDVIFFPTGTDEMQTSSPAAGRPLLAPATSSGRGNEGLRRRFVVSLPAAIGYALAATLAGFLIRGAMLRRDAVQVAAAPDRQAAESTSLVTPVASLTRRAEETPVAVQFVLDADRAKSVSLVGDFNAWDGTSTPLARDSASGVWSAVIHVTPGRHVYAFLVDGEKWTLDPRAPWGCNDARSTLRRRAVRACRRR
jgi:hypothetical protein